MKHKNNTGTVKVKNLVQQVIFNTKHVGLFFLGVGATMFVINVTTIINLYPVIAYLNSLDAAYSLNGYYVSIVSSLILMAYSLYNVFENND